MIQLRRSIRWYQRPFYDAMIGGNRPGGKKRLIEIAHRRWGKDEIALAATCQNALDRPASYWHCLPEYEQGRKAIWTSVNAHTGKRRIDEAFPDAIRENVDEKSMFIRLKNGSTWQVIGSDRYDSTVGAGVGGIVFSEWALANPEAWAYYRPMIAENNGFASFITTPRGRNHAYSMYMGAVHRPEWFAEISGVQHTEALNKHQLTEALKDYIDIFGEDAARAKMEQEYFCSFNAAILGAFYGRELARLRAEGRITEEAVANPKKPVHRAWDIGVRDDTTIWFFQVQGGQPVVLDVYSTNGVGVDHYAHVIKQKIEEHGWFEGPSSDAKGIDYVPHDAAVQEWGTGRTRLESMLQLGLNPSMVPNVAKLDGINAARRTLAMCIFHPRTEEKGISALEQYQREWDSDKKMFRERELHDWTSHYADAFRYLSLVWKTAPSSGIYDHDGNEIAYDPEYLNAIKQPFFGKNGWILPPPPDAGY